MPRQSVTWTVFPFTATVCPPQLVLPGGQYGIASQRFAQIGGALPAGLKQTRFRQKPFTPAQSESLKQFVNGSLYDAADAVSVTLNIGNWLRMIGAQNTPHARHVAMINMSRSDGSADFNIPKKRSGSAGHAFSIPPTFRPSFRHWSHRPATITTNQITRSSPHLHQK